MKSATVLLMLCATALGKTFYPATYQSLGCWNDQSSSRAIALMEGHSYLDGTYDERVGPIQKCARVAATSDYEVFGVQNGGQCFSASKARSTYSKYGESSKCKGDGEGGPYSNDIYELKSYGKVSVKSLGCWKDTSVRAIPTLEGLDSNLDGSYGKRKDALKKCVDAAFSRGYKVIALQHGGWCAGSRDALSTYKKYGQSDACPSDGEGGDWANQVYELTYHWVKYY